MSTDHKIWVLFQMEEMDGTSEESAEILLDLYVADEVTVLTVLPVYDDHESANLDSPILGLVHDKGAAVPIPKRYVSGSSDDPGGFWSGV